MFFGVRGPFGSRRVSGPGQNAKKRQKTLTKSLRFKGHFGTLSAFLRACFLVYFQVRAFSALWAIWWPRGGQKGGFRRSCRGHLGGGANM